MKEFFDVTEGTKIHRVADGISFLVFCAGGISYPFAVIFFLFFDRPLGKALLAGVAIALGLMALAVLGRVIFQCLLLLAIAIGALLIHLLEQVHRHGWRLDRWDV